MSSLVFRITGDTSAFKAAMGEVSGVLEGVGSKATSLSANLDGLGNKLSIGITAPAVAMGTAFIKASADMDTLKRAMVSTTGSAEAAATQFARLEQIAKLPGIGLEEAVRGSIRLQNYGLSASLAEKALRNFSNAVAASGGSAEDTQEALRQLGQMFGRGQVTMDNLRVILERVPQAASIIRKEFGSEALADPAKAFEKLGINSQQFVEILINKLGEVQQVAPGVKTSLENLAQEAQKAAARIGDKLVPTLTEALPKLEELAIAGADLVDQFVKLPQPIQDVAVGMGVLAVASGPVAKSAALFMSLGESVKWAGSAFVALPPQAKAVVVALSTLAAIGPKIKRDIDDLRDALNPAKATGADYELISTISGKYREMDDSLKALVSTAGGLNGVPSTFQILSDATGTLRSKTLAHAKAQTQAAEAVEIHQKAMDRAKLPTLELALLHERMRDAYNEESKAINAGADILARYGAVTVETAKQRSAAANLIFTTNRDLQASMGGAFDAPEMPGFGIDFGKLPKAPKPELPIPGSFEEFKQMGKNIGELGMMTKEQYKAMEEAAKTSSKGQKFALHQVSLAITDLSRGITDAIFKGGKFGDVMKNIALDVSKSITRLLIEGALKRLGESLLGLGKTSTSIFGGIGSMLGGIGKVFGSGGTGAVMSAVPGVTAVGLEAGGLAGIPGLASSGGSGAASAVGGIASAGVTGVVGAIGGVVSAVSGIIGNFQMKGMNKTLDLIEKSTRYTEAYTLSILDKVNGFLPKLADIHDRLIEFRQLGIKLEAGGSLTLAGAGAGGDSYYFDFSGANLGNATPQSFEAALMAAVTKMKQKGLAK